MPVRVRLLGDFREKAGAREVEVEARNLWELLEKLTERYEGLRNLFFGEGRLGRNVHLLVNGTPILEAGNLPSRGWRLMERFIRQMAISGFGQEGQRRLEQSCVLVVGMRG